jgi:nicotinamidase-related amidase
MDRHPFILDRRRAVLLVIDVQERINAVMSSQGHLVRLQVLAEACRDLGVPVLATEQYPKGLGPTVTELAEVLPGPPIVKDTFSCGGEPKLVDALRELDRRQVVVTGIEAHVCVVQTALDLLGAGYQVHLPHDAVQSRRPADRDHAIDRMATAGAVVTSTESALFELAERCGTDDFRTVAKLVKKIPVGDR